MAYWAIKGDDNLQDMFAATLEVSRIQSVSVPIPVDGTRIAAVIRLIPASQDAKSQSTGFYRKLIITPVALDIGIPESDIVAGLFNLTHAETRLAVALASDPPAPTSRECLPRQGQVSRVNSSAS